MSLELLLEIGTEEIPSGYLADGLSELRRLAESCLRENRIDLSGELRVCGTPRRLVVIATGITDQQRPLVQEFTGPPRNVAYDADGRPGKAALGFAEKQGVPVEALKWKDTPKGQYLYVRREVPGRPAVEVFSEVLHNLIADIPWPKVMRWGNIGFPFVRPIHWFLALLNGEIIPCEVAGVPSGNTTMGHRFMAPVKIHVLDVKEYLEKMEKAFVILDPKERERMVERVTGEAAEKVGGKPAEDQELVTTVSSLVEYPSAVCGSFDRGFLDLPDAVLITAMREHQKYFAVYDREKRLMPHFVAVNNTVARDESVVRKGHERVLRARLSDANFFFKEDRKRPLEGRLEDLRDVIYQAELGTSYEKVYRFTRLAEDLAAKVLPEKTDAVIAVARLCKCDLVTQMVCEFPSLQGVMGRAYAREEGYPEEICEAIEQHYLPTRAGGDLPSSAIGAIVGIADRMDTIAGCFSVGLEPTGSADPFALRRHALAILRILETTGWDFSFRELIEKAISLLHGQLQFDVDAVFSRVLDFFEERYRQMLLRAGYETDFIEAIISVEFDRIHLLRSRIDQLKRFASASEDFEGLALTAKRINNILKNQDRSLPVRPEFFEERCESDLWETYLSLRERVGSCLEKRDYFGAMQVMAGLRKPVDDFFDGVEILSRDNQELRANRVALLQHLAGLFSSVADFSKFSI